jgi:hypothetical protein
VSAARWTADTEESIAALLQQYNGVIWRRPDSDNASESILRHLAAEGLLLPPGAETTEQWAVRVDKPHPKRIEKAGDYLLLPGGEQIAKHGPRIWDGWVPVRRNVYIGPWSEVPS